MTSASVDIILASTSPTRIALLTRAGVPFRSLAPRVDEETLRTSLEAEGVTPRDMADVLAEQKARKIAERHPDAIVIGADQVLEFEGRAWSKPPTAEAARQQLLALRGGTHSLHSAIVLCEAGRPVWRFLGGARLSMRSFSDAYVDAYLSRNWPEVGGSPGCYRVEDEGMRLFDRIDGDHFTILGLPMLPLLGYLGQRGWIAA
jgi:septum formation protein